MRNETGAAARIAVLLRTRIADVRTAQLRRLVEEQCVIRLFVGKGLSARLAGVGAGLYVPLVHERIHLTTNEHE